ncbi:hypothetical protein Ddye_025123 [Dipteronia dyeriana]|uniref:Uncharacterized protein n=1 Tax=Dipteronia dyeriana TaxID=168575 RepID=A0AAD9TX55_9ROSI|nr:hypothetical protein Ddye_025123 [Dipteronia dyeriana]
MAPQVVHFKGASSRGEKRKEIGASKLTFDGRKKKKAPENHQNSWKDLNLKVSLLAEEDFDVNAIKDPDLDANTNLYLDTQLGDNLKCLKWQAQSMDIYKHYGKYRAFCRDSPEESPELRESKLPPFIIEVDGLIVDPVKERELKRPLTIELEGAAEMVKEIQQKGQEQMVDHLI